MFSIVLPTELFIIVFALFLLYGPVLPVRPDGKGGGTDKKSDYIIEPLIEPFEAESGIQYKSFQAAALHILPWE